MAVHLFYQRQCVLTLRSDDPRIVWEREAVFDALSALLRLTAGAESAWTRRVAREAVEALAVGEYLTTDEGRAWNLALLAAEAAPR